MNSQQTLVSFWTLFFSFNGRMSRTRYWAISIPYWIVFWLLFIAFEDTFGPDKTWIVTLIFFIGAVFTSTKRLHDRDKSGWWLLLIFIPVIGPIWLIIELGFLTGTVGSNSHGENPLEANYDYLTVK